MYLPDPGRGMIKITWAHDILFALDEKKKREA